MGIDVAVDPSGSFVYVAGWTQSAPSGNQDVLLVKFESNCNFVWAQSWDFEPGDVALRVKVDPSDGSIVLGGFTGGNSASQSAALLMKVADPGSTPPQAPVWATSWDLYYTSVSDFFFGVSGGIYSCSSTIPPASNGIDAYLARYDSTGNLQWVKTWNRDVNDAAYSCTSDASGNVYVAGYSGEWASSGQHDAYLLKFDPNGVLQWANTWGTGRNDGVARVITDTNGNVFLAGLTNGLDGTQEDMLLLKYDASGNLLESNIRRGDGDSRALSAVGALGAIFLAGDASNNAGSWQTFSGTLGTGPTTTTLQSVSSVSISLTPTNVVGTTSAPTGVEDTGGGGDDALILAASAIAAAVSPTALTFGNQAVNTTSPAQSVTLSNTGSATLNISSITASADFAQTNTCAATLGLSATCTISVTFKPTATGLLNGTLTVTDDAPNSPQTVTLTGTGTGPMVSLSATSLTFSAQMSGTNSAAQTVTLTNTGNASLTVSSITASGDFSPTNTCGSSVAAGANCTISVTFKPVAGGTRTGTLSISDDASDSPQSVALSGTGQDFTVATASGSPTSVTVAPGSPASYTLTVGGEGGFNQSVSFTCTGAPSEATCTVSPSPVTPGTSATSITVSVTTTAPSASAPHSRPLPPLPPLSPGLRGLLMLALALAAIAWAIMRRNQPGLSRWQSTMLSLASGLLLTLALAGCGGGGGTTRNPGTPAGTYTLTVTGSTGSGSSALSQSVTLTLNVS